MTKLVSVCGKFYFQVVNFYDNAVMVLVAMYQGTPPVHSATITVPPLHAPQELIWPDIYGPTTIAIK